MRSQKTDVVMGLVRLAQLYQVILSHSLSESPCGIDAWQTMVHKHARRLHLKEGASVGNSTDSQASSVA